MTEEEAYQRGVLAARSNGPVTAPSMDPEIRKALVGRQVGDPYNVMIMKAWNRGWTKEQFSRNDDEAWGTG